MEWREPAAIELSDDLRARAGGHALIAERLASLGLLDADAAAAFLNPDLFQCASPFELPGMDVAVTRVKAALRTGEPILLWGDYDVDGQAATALLFNALKARGANVRFHLPRRNDENHGLTLSGLRELLAHHELAHGFGYRLVITCGTGVTAHAALEFAQREGVDAIVIDHQQLPAASDKDKLPALALLHPQRLPHGHKMRALPAAGIAYEFMRALNDGVECPAWLDLVALGIVAASAMLQGQTRYLLQRGLAMLRVSQRPAWAALCARAEINQLEIDERDLATRLVPRLHAQGIFGEAADAAELLTTSDPARAQQLSFQIEALNAQRKLAAQNVAASALSLLERDPSLLEYAALVLAHPDWDSALTGPVAQQLAATYQRPVVLLGEKAELACGSARSVAGCNITEALAACQTRLVQFGGHAMAARLTLPRAEIYDLRRDLSATVRARRAGPATAAALRLDATVTLDQLTPELYEDVQRLAPFGHGNAPLLFAARGVQTVRQKKLGRANQHVRLTIADASGIQQPLFWWNADPENIPTGRFDAAFRFVLNRYKQQAQLVLELVDWQAREDQHRTAAEPKPAFEVEDYRQHFDQRGQLQARLAAAALVWREADDSVTGATRNELQRAETFIVWTVPPGRTEWQAALDTVQPHRLILFGQTPTPLTVKSWVQRLAGLAKYALKQKGGQTSLATLAAVTAQRETSVRYGLLWLQQAGKLGVTFTASGGVQLTEEPHTAAGYELNALEKLIESALAETQAYRKYWLCSERIDDTAKQ